MPPRTARSAAKSWMALLLAVVSTMGLGIVDRNGAPGVQPPPPGVEHAHPARGPRGPWTRLAYAGAGRSQPPPRRPARPRLPGAEHGGLAEAEQLLRLPRAGSDPGGPLGRQEPPLRRARLG